MSDDQRKPGSASDTGDDADQNPFQYLDRDTWYDDDASRESVAGEQIPGDTEGAEPMQGDDPYAALQPGSEAADSQPIEPAEILDVEESPGLPVDEETGTGDATLSDEDDDTAYVPGDPDPYDFGAAPRSAADDEADAESLAYDEPAGVDDRPDEPQATMQAGSGDGDALPAGIAGIGAGWSAKAGSFLRRFVDPFEDALKPARALVATTAQRVIVWLAVLISLICLLADNAALALMIPGFVLPLLIVIAISRLDVFETEPPLILFGVGAVGLAAGLIIGAIGAWVVREQWIDIGTLNFGAVGFGGVYADAEGNANVLVWLVNGLLLPLAALAAIIGVPIALRRYAAFRNEIMDGAILGTIGAAGYAIGTLIIFLSPGVDDGLPWTSVSDWTLTTFAVLLLRPLVITLGGAMLGIAVWRYMRSGDLYSLILPAIGSVGAWLLLAMGSIQLQPSGVSIEFIWHLVIAAGVYVLYRRVVAEAIAIDRAALGSGGNRVVCPHCRKVTPAGAFCANCGKSLT